MFKFWRLRYILLIALALFTIMGQQAPIAQANPPAHDKKVILYYPDWRGGVDISAYADRLTHLQYAFIYLEEDGSCRPGDSAATVAHLQELKTDYPHLKVLLSIGGWTWSENFAGVAADPAKRATMVDSCLALSRGYGFDGLDLDWEHPVVGGEPDSPGSFADVANYVTILEEIRAEMIGDEELSIAIGAASSIYSAFDLAALAAPLDNVNIMTYDMSGGWTRNAYHHSPLYDNPLDTLNNNSAKNVDDFLAAGVPPEKIIMGVAFYGRGWQDVPNNGENGVGQPGGDAIEMSYDQILGMIGNNGYTRYWDDLAKAPYVYSETANGGTWIGYDDPQSMCEKAKFALERDIGGLMGWEITQNLSNDDLMSAIDSCLQDGMIATPTPEPTVDPAMPTDTPTLEPTTDPAATPLPADSMLPNGDFSEGISGWYNVGFVADASTGAGCADVTNPGQFAWDVIFGSTTELLIENGSEYRLTFTAWADEPTQINALVAYNQAPWTTYLLETLGVGTAAQTYEYAFTMTETTDPNSVFAFQLGGQQATTVCIDDVSLVETFAAQPTAVPTPTITPTPIPSDQQCDVMISDWYGGAQSAISLTFDDGYQSQHQYARPILSSHEMPATFFITANVLGFGAYMSWAEVNELAADGHEIAAHTMTHPHLPDLDEGSDTDPGTQRWELAEANKQIEQNVPDSVPIISFAYPFADFNTPVRGVTMDYYEAARNVASANIFNQPSPDWSQINSYEPGFSPVRSAADEADEFAIAQNWTDEIISRETWGVMDGHSVVPFDELGLDNSWQPIASEWLDQWLTYIKSKADNNEVWVATMGDATRYIKQRDHSVCLLMDETADQHTYTFTDDLDDAIYAHPLSVMLPVPANWTADSVSVTQNGAAVPVDVVTENGVMIASADIIPDGGSVVLATGSTPTTPLAVGLQAQSSTHHATLIAALFVTISVIIALFVGRKVLA